MKLGAVYPQAEADVDSGRSRAYLQALEELGYDVVFVADRVLGNDARFHQSSSMINYTHDRPVHEPLTFLAWAAGITQTLLLSTGILVLPQRQTVMVAKQAAEVDLLSGGRLRLGVGVGWNRVEYDALGMPFEDRGRRMDEQIDLMRQLWTHETVNYEGAFHSVDHAGLSPRPIQRPIPVWLGLGAAGSDRPPPAAALRRVARLADGWCPSLPPGPPGAAVVAEVDRLVSELGRARLPMQGRVQVASRTPEDWDRHVQDWKGRGADEILAETRQGGLSFPDGHVAALAAFRDAVRAVG